MLLRFLLCFALTATTLSSCDVIQNLPQYGTVTQTEAAEALRQALDNGVGSGIAALNKQDGFFGNEAYKLFLPAEAQKIENTLRQLGMGSLVDRAILQINRAAEDAVGYAKPIFVEAIRGMTIADAISIVRGPNNAATAYFRERTRTALLAAFEPTIRKSLDRVSATKYYDDIVNTYNRFPTTVNKVNPDLTAYVVNRALDALFDGIAKEELRIREDPVARTTDLLKKVFGWAKSAAPRPQQGGTGGPFKF